MPGIGIPSTPSADFTLTRDKMIELAYKLIGVLEPGQTLDGEELDDGVQFLSMIIREVDASGKLVWTREDAAHVPLTEGVFYYDADTNLPENIADLLTAAYRTADGVDVPLKVWKAEEYERISDKLAYGMPKGVYLTEHKDLDLRGLYIWPLPQGIGTQSVIQGSDSLVYRCIRSHTSALSSQPVTGGNWRLLWEQGGASVTPWAADTAYTACAQLRLKYRRPLYDFQDASSAPDFPLPWPRHLVFRLAFDLADMFGIPEEKSRRMIEKASGAFQTIFPSTQVKSTNLHHKSEYF